MKYFKSTIFFLIILFLFSNCKKEDKPDTAEYSLSFSHRALEYVQLTEGKYLIYKDSATSLLDSVIIVNSTIENLFTPQSSGFITPSYNHERFRLLLSKYEGTSVTEWFNGTADLVFSTLPFASSDTETVRMYEQDGTPAYNFGESSQSNLTMTIEGRTFNNVEETINDSGVAINHPAYKVTAYYWAKGVGIIKRRTIKTGGVIKTYTLLRNN